MRLDHHGLQDYQSLLMHQEAVRMIQADPSLAERALETLSRWDTPEHVHSKPLLDQWVKIIKRRNWKQKGWRVCLQTLLHHARWLIPH